MNELDILEELNEILEGEDGNRIQPEDYIKNSGVDSFGFSMFVITVDDLYHIWTKEEFENIDYANLTMQNVIDLIKEKL